MPATLDIHEPLLVNTLGHSIGVLIFGTLIYLFLRDWKGAGARRSLLPSLAAALSLLWNLGSLIVLALGQSAGLFGESVVAFSFAVLSILPAVLLHISLGGRMAPLRFAGYAFSAFAVCLHLAEGFVAGRSSMHEAAMLTISAGFGSITVAAAVAHRLSKGGGSSLARIMGTMAFFLFAMSFVHFGSVHGPEAWSAEIAVHHAGIPLALVVLLQEYRFLLLDTFLRFLANAALATGTIMVAALLQERYDVVALARQNSFVEAMAFLAAGTTLFLFGYLRTALQHQLTHVVFRRAPIEETLREIRTEAMKAQNLAEVLESVKRLIASYTGVERAEWRIASPEESRSEPELVSDFVRWRDSSDGNWAEAVMPLWLNQEGCRLLLLGRRHGGRRYLSEDLQNLTRMANVAAEEVERLRTSETKRLVSEAEYRALQAQIHPHFLFNSLNALYGSIPRQAEGARRMVLNLSQVFRYFLRSDRSLIPLGEELAIVQAYLEIEKLRLGDRLRTEIDVKPEFLAVHVPVLSIQPLIENAIRHGVAQKPGPGWVRLTAKMAGRKMRVEVSDSGGSFHLGTSSASSSDGAGIGLDNVRQRLRLSFGPEADTDFQSTASRTTIGFEVPMDGKGYVAAHQPKEAVDSGKTPA